MSPRPQRERFLPPEGPRSPASDGSEGWRRARLSQAGFAPPQAASLAGERAVDLHALIELVERGCPPELAARILAPVERE